MGTKMFCPLIHSFIDPMRAMCQALCYLPKMHNLVEETYTPMDNCNTRWFIIMIIDICIGYNKNPFKTFILKIYNLVVTRHSLIS